MTDGSSQQSSNDNHKRLDPALQEFYDSHGIELSSFFMGSSIQKSDGETNDKDNQINNNNKNNPFRYRFVRLNPRFDKHETLTLLTKELGENDIEEQPIHVPWLPTDDFYALSGNFRLNSSPSFQAGRIYGMDVSSGASIGVLLTKTYDRISTPTTTTTETSTMMDRPGSTNLNCSKLGNQGALRVLDLCCCPGLKLCSIADQIPIGSTVIGVDISSSRMALCSKIVEKYHVDPKTSGRQGDDSPTTIIQLYCQDGTMLGTSGLPEDNNLIFDSTVAHDESISRGSRKRKNKSARARERKRLQQIASPCTIGKEDNRKNKKQEGETDEMEETVSDDKNVDPVQSIVPTIEPFDYVLVDAECSTDGSLKHLRERLKEGDRKTSSNTLLTTNEQLADLVDLQQRLILSGFRLLKSGGTLVYSTCSLSSSQNENVVMKLLKDQDDAYLIPVEFALANSKLITEGSIPGTIRFYPNIGQHDEELFGDGFFLAKIGKR